MTVTESRVKLSRRLLAKVRTGSARIRARRLALLIGFECGAEVGMERGVTIVLDADGRLTIGARTHISAGTVLHAGTGARLSIGSDVFIGHNCVVMCKESVAVGSRVAMAESVSVRDHDHKIGASPASGGLAVSPVVIADDVWIAAKATITRGCTLGARCVVGAGAVVTHDVDAESTVVGVPARPIVRSTS